MKQLLLSLFCVLSIVAIAQNASLVYVNANSGNDSFNGLAPTPGPGNVGPKKTVSGVQGAIRVVAEGGIISVASGFYNEHVIQDKSIVLVKTGSGSASFLSWTFAQNAVLLPGLPAPDAFEVSNVTVNAGSHAADGLLLVRSGGTVFLSGQQYNETVTAYKSCTLYGIENAQLQNLNLNGPGLLLSLGNDFTITGFLSFSGTFGGKIDLNGQHLFLAPQASCTPGNAISYVITGTTGQFVRQGMTNTTFVFPVGTYEQYTPVTFTDQNNLGQAIGVNVRYAGNPLAFEPDLPSVVNAFVNLQWTINSGAGSGHNATVRFDYASINQINAWENAQNKVLASTQGTDWTPVSGAQINDGWASGTFTSFNKSVAVYSDFPNSLPSESNIDWVCYPNPFNDQIIVSSAGSTAPIQWTLVDLSGKIIHQGFGNESSNLISGLAHLNAGFYLLKVQQGRTSKVFRMVKT